MGGGGGGSVVAGAGVELGVVPLRGESGMAGRHHAGGVTQVGLLVGQGGHDERPAPIG